VAAHLEYALGEPVSVINATGGKGVTGHLRGLRARPDGYTIAMITIELNMMHHSGLTDLTYEDCIPLVSLNEDAAAIFVRKDDDRWQTIADLEDFIRENPGELRASGTATGGAWHLALANWMLAAGMDVDAVRWISSEGAGPSLQELMGGGFDFVCCSLPEAETFETELRPLGVMASERVAAYDQVPTFKEQGTDAIFVGWRGLAVPLGTPPAVVDTLMAALEKVVTGQTRGPDGQTFLDLMRDQKFDHTSRLGGDFRAFLAETDEKLGALLTNDAMASVNSDPFNPLTFPIVIMALMLVTFVGTVVQTLFISKESTLPEEAFSDRAISRQGIIRAALFVAAVVVYIALVETIGFVLLSALVAFALFWLLKVRVWAAAAIAIVVAAAIYQLFAHLLRVPLPRGIFGW
jgi:tripartite-type tricarboxylate transporter receptor subunit TctC